MTRIQDSLYSSRQYPNDKVAFRGAWSRKVGYFRAITHNYEGQRFLGVNVGKWHGRVIQRDNGSMAVRILLVDDHPIVRQGLRTLLEGRSGWEVVGEASDGVEALEKVEALQPDVVVLDVTMPRMNGLEACRSLQKRKIVGIEVLFVTQHDSPQMMREALDAGARGYVVKSNAARDLLEAVEAVSQHREFTALARTPQTTAS